MSVLVCSLFLIHALYGPMSIFIHIIKVPNTYRMLCATLKEGAGKQKLHDPKEKGHMYLKCKKGSVLSATDKTKCHRVQKKGCWSSNTLAVRGKISIQKARTSNHAWFCIKLWRNNGHGHMEFSEWVSLQNKQIQRGTDLNPC